ncbi:hypothetical protein TNCV_2094991 [Trichonephila clavipes]|nr:hypothetical protein TNCV_2094991 [Trichonephila clavipes]
MPDPDYMVDALKHLNQTPRVSGKSLQTCMVWRCPDGTLYFYFYCWPILAVSVQSLAENGPVVDSRDVNLAFGQTEVSKNKLLLFSPPKYIVELPGH